MEFEDTVVTMDRMMHMIRLISPALPGRARRIAGEIGGGMSAPVICDSRSVQASSPLRFRNYGASLFLRCVFSAFFLFLFNIFTPNFSHAAGGDILWQFGDAKGGKQAAKAMAVDSDGNVIIAGFHTISGMDNEFYTAKITQDGSGASWTAAFNKSTGDDEVVSLVVDSANDVIVTGYVWNGTNFDIQTMKYHGGTGAVVWQATFNGSADGNDIATAITFDGLNNIYVAGYTQNASGNDDYVLLKYNSNGPNADGTPARQVIYGGTANGVDRTTSLTAGADGVAVTGYSWNGVDFDYLTVKYDFNCSLLWEKRYSSPGNNADKGLFVKMDASGNVAVTGSLSNGTNQGIYTATYDRSNGAVIREWSYDNGYDDEPRGLWIDSSGNIYITGYTWSLAGRYEFYTAKYNASTGAVVWEKTFGSGSDNDDVTVATGILLDEADNIFVTGYTYKPAAGNYDMQTIKYAKENGSELWQRTFDGAAQKDDMPVGIGLAPSGDIIVAGWSDAWTAGSSDFDYYAIKYDAGLLNAPTQLAAETVSNSEIALTWTDNAANEDGFTIERKIGENGAYAEIITVPVHPLSANTIAYTDAGLDPDTKYYYRVMAFNAANGNSHYSNEANAFTRIVPYSPPSWSYRFNGEDNNDDVPYAIAVGPDNHPVVTGMSFSEAGSFDYYTVKFDRTDGSVIWNARYDGDQNDLDVAVAAAVNNSNEVLISGFSSLYSADAGKNTNDIYTIKYPSSGPPEDWHDLYDGPSHNDDRSTAVVTAVDGSNNFVVVGYGKNGTLPVIGNDDIYVIRYLADGTRDWAAVPVDGPAHGNDYPSAVAVDMDGNIFVSGYVHNGANYDFFTAKYCGHAAAPCGGKNKGEIIWSDIYGGAGNGNDYAKALAVDELGNVYVAGYVLNSSGNEDFYVIKYNGTTGAKIWERSFDGPAHGNDEALSIKIDPIDGDVVIAGTTLTGDGNNDFMIIRYHANGDEAWAGPKTLYRLTNDDYVVDMGMDLSGNVCVAGTTSNGSTTDMLSVKFNHEGTVIGASVYNGPADSYDYATAVAVNNLGEAFIAGYSRNANGNDDYVVYKCSWDSLQVPSPLSAVPGYTHVALSWQDNATSELGFYIERKLGACSSANAWGGPTLVPANETTYTDPGLNIGTEFCYRIQAFGENGTASRWIEKAVTTLSPAAPGDLTAIAANTTQINLSWTDNTTEETGFTIERCLGASCDFSAKDILSAGTNTTNYNDTSVLSGQTYRYRILAFSTSEWESAFSQLASASTPPPVAPSGLSAVTANTTRIDLSWTRNTSDETGFTIERCEGEGCVNFTEIISVGSDPTVSYSDTTVCNGATYTYRVKAYKSGKWESSYSNEASAATPVLNPPALTAARNSESQVDLSWSDGTADEAGFRIFRCEGPGCIPVDPPLAVVGSNITEYADTTVAHSATYRYMVKAYKTATCPWESASSLSEAATDILPPGGLTTTAANTTEIDLSWTDTAGSETGFLIERCTDGVDCPAFSAIATTGPNVTSFTDTTACSATNYIYRLKTRNEELSNTGGGCWSNMVPLTITNFQQNLQTQVMVDYAAAMQPDFDDIRFYDETDHKELPYWIELKTDGVSATVWVKTGANNAISLYYGNPSAASAGNGDSTFEFFDDFNGPTLEAAKWTVGTISSTAGTVFSQSGGFLSGGNNNRYIQSLPVFTGSYIAETRILETTSAPSGFTSIGFYAASGNNIGMVPYNGSFYSINDGNLNYMGAFPAGKWSRDRVSANGSTSSVSRTSEDGSPVLTRAINNSGLDSERVRMGARYEGSTYNQNFAAYWDWIFVRKYASPAPVVALGAEASTSCYAFAGTWDSAYSNEAPVSSPAPSAPFPLTATGENENQISLAWTDNTADETGFKIERKDEACASNGLSFTQIALFPTADTFTSGIDAELWDQAGLLESTSSVTPPININDAGGSAYISSTNGGVELKTASMGTGAAGSFNYSAVRLKNPGSVKGDFDIQIDYSLPDGQVSKAQYHVYARLEIIFPTTGAAGWNNVSAERIVSGSSNLYQGNIAVDGTWHGASVATADSFGKLRIKRTGSTLYTYAWTNGAWTLLHQYANTPTSAATSVQVIQYAQRNEAVILRAYADNYRYSSSGYDDMDLNSGQTYCYQVRAFKTTSCGWDGDYSNTAEATTPAPPAPGNLRAKAVNTTQVDLAWTDNTGSETGFVIERCSGSGCVDFSTLAATDANVTAYSDTSACNTAVHRYRVKATKNTAPLFDTAYSNEAAAATYAPGNLVSDSDFENATTAWTGATGTLTGTSFDAVTFYNSAASLKLAATGAVLGRQQTVTVTPGAQYVLTGYLNASLAAGTAQCDVLGTGIDSAGISIASGSPNNNAGWVYLTETVTIPAGTTSVNIRCFADGSPQGTVYLDLIQLVPVSVMTLTAARASEVQADLSWTNTTNDETGFEILRCAGPGCTPAEPPIATVGPNVTTYSDMWLAQSTTYRYSARVFKSSACAWSASSLISEVTTTVVAPVLSASPVNTTQVNLSWTNATSSETGFVLERCQGAGCGDFSPAQSLAADATSYSDSAVCESTTYNYRVKAVSEGLSNSNGGVWTRRLPLTIDGFQPDFLTRMVIPYNPVMRADFGDIRFYDEAHVHELPYWIENKTDGNSAIVWFKTGDNSDTIYLYYGNAAATSSSSLSGVFGAGLMGFWQFDEPVSTVAGTTADASGQGNHGTFTGFSSPYGVVAGGRFGNGLSLNGTSNYVKRDSTSLPTGSVASVEAWIYPTGYSTDANYTGVVSWGGRYCNGNAVLLSAQNNGRPSMATWCNDYVPSEGAVAALNAWNHIALVLNGKTATLYMNGQPLSGTLTYNPNIKQGNLSIGSADYPGRYFSGLIDEVRVYNRALSSAEISSRYAATDPAVSTGLEETSAGFPFANAFDIVSNTAAATTPAPGAPSSLTATRISEVQVNLSWTDNTTDETGFKVERCTENTGAGIDCTNPADYSQIAAADAPGAGTGIKTYANTGIIPGKTYSYRVRAYKSGVTCGWDSDYSGTASATTTLIAPVLTASPANTTQIDLSWTDSTSSETGFMIERCPGIGCSNFAPLAAVGLNAVSFADTTVCNSSPYSYRIRAVNEGLSNGVGNCWIKRIPLVIADFQPDYQTRIVIPYDPDMRSDFGDIRFYDETAGSELPYWIETKTDGDTATVWFKTGANNAVYLYYGNSGAASVSSGQNTFEFFDDFRGSAIDTNKWSEIDPDNSLYQNDGLVLNDVSDSWSKALISKQNFTRTPDKMLYLKLTIPADTPGNNHFMAGWESNQTADPSYTQLVHGFYWNNYLFTTYEKGTHTGPNNQTYTAADYEMKIKLMTSGADYSIKGGAYASWTAITPSSVLNYTDSPLRLAFIQYSHQARIHFVAVQRYASTEPSAVLGTEETSACYAYPVVWEGSYSNEAAATPPAPASPAGLSATAVTDTRIDLAWTDAMTDETGFRIERCTGAGCSDFAEIAATGANMNSYSDEERTPSLAYCYRVKTYKIAACGWDTGYSAAVCDLTFSASPTVLTATALNSMKIQLAWSDNAQDEDGYEIEVMAWNGKWVRIASTGPNVQTFIDTMGIEPNKQYVYRVRAVRGADNSPYSNEAAVTYTRDGVTINTTPDYAPGDHTCQYELRVNTAGPGAVIRSTAGASCGTGCYAYCLGSSITLRAVPEAGKTFNEWSGDYPAACSGASTCTIVMDGNKNITATFE